MKKGLTKEYEEYGKNQHKFNGRLVSYFPTVGKMPNKAKFRNEYQKQVWIYVLEAIVTYNLYTLLGKFEEEENLIIHNINQPIEVYITGLRGPVSMGSKRSLQAFELKERSRNIIIQTREKRTIIVVESVIPESNHKRVPQEIEMCHTIDKALTEQREYGFKLQPMINMRNSIIFISAQGCYDETIMQEHLVEVTIMDYQDNIILSTLITPRVFVTINPSHLGFDEDELIIGKDEINMMKEIRKLAKNKIIIGYDIKKTLRLCNIYTNTIQGYIDLEKNKLLTQKSGVLAKQIKLSQLTKRFNIKTKHPLSTTQRCKVYKQLWKKIEYELLDILQITEQYQEQDVLELQNQMEDEFTSIGRTPTSLPRTLVKETSRSEIRNLNIEATITKPSISVFINTSPMKRLRITSNEDNEQITLLESIQKRCRVHNSNIPKICLINGEQYQIQAIIATPIKETNQIILCQTSKVNDSQGREILKGGRNVKDL